MPVVAIVGRPNVGKSSLLNALTKMRISIVQDMPGVTRDRVSTPLDIGGHFVELIDTGGYGFDDAQGLTAHIKQQIEIAMSRANLILFIVDCEAGLTAGDEEMALMLRRKGAKVVLIANKADSPKSDASLADFAKLGFGTPVGVAAISRRNIDQMFKAIRDNIDLEKAPIDIPPPQMSIAIVGKRNAGKSTLVNAIARIYEDDPQRVIVSEVPGTTRDSVDVRFEKDNKSLIVIDTAGVRKKRHMVNDDVEFYSFHRAQRSIRRADVVMMLIDGTEPLSEPDKKLARYISDQMKPVILVINKWDLTMKTARESMAEPKEGEKRKSVRDEDLMEEYGKYISDELKHLDYAPVAFVTASDGRNVQATLDLAQHLFHQTNERVGTGRLNKAVERIFEERMPSNKSGRRVKVFYATQVEVAPPTIVLVVNNPDYVNEQYQRFMLNRFRELLPFDEVPIKLLIRARSRGAAGDAAESAGDFRRPIRSANGSGKGSSTKRSPAKTSSASRASKSSPPGAARGKTRMKSTHQPKPKNTRK